MSAPSNVTLTRTLTRPLSNQGQASAPQPAATQVTEKKRTPPAFPTDLKTQPSPDTKGTW
jgi:hypothetical protein